VQKLHKDYISANKHKTRCHQGWKIGKIMSIWKDQQNVTGQAGAAGELIMQRTAQAYLYIFIYH
jgi:hypothetical protein